MNNEERKVSFFREETGILVPFFKYTSGHLGVILFFVISGYLITYLMLLEKNEFNKINIRNFYIRRILRIWPIYFLIILLLIFVFPKIISIDYFGKVENIFDWNLQGKDGHRP